MSRSPKHVITASHAAAPSTAAIAAAFVLCTAASGLQAQATLPATAPTAPTASQLPSANPPVPRGAALIHWDGHLLQVTASGEPLTQVLADIATRTGTRLHGSLPDDRIYGTYGPAPLVDLFSELLDGLPVNTLFVDQMGTKPAELTFTARTGAATPPSPTPAQTYAPQQVYSQQQPAPLQPVQPPPVSQPAPGFGAPPASAANGSGSNGTPTGTSADSATTDSNGNPISPNGVKTPQQIFQELQRLRSAAGGQQQ